MRNAKNGLSTLTALVILFLTIVAPAATVADSGQTVNILILVGDGTSGTFNPIAPFILSLDGSSQTARVIGFSISTRIAAVTREAGETSISMGYLSHCETGEIVKAYETTFGIPIDRYLFLAYQYGSFESLVGALDMLCPVTLDIPEILMGDTQFTTVNGNMPMFAEAMNREYTLVAGAQAQELDTVGFISYFAAAPSININTVDWIVYPMDSYRLWDMKCQAALKAFIPRISRMDQAEVLAFWTLITDGQDTDITADDIGRWSAIPYSFPADCYLSVPGFENAKAQEFDASAFTSYNFFPQMLLAYDSEAVISQIHTFISGE